MDLNVYGYMHDRFWCVSCHECIEFPGKRVKCMFSQCLKTLQGKERSRTRQHRHSDKILFVG